MQLNGHARYAIVTTHTTTHATNHTREVCHRNHTQHIVSAATHLPDHELVQAKRVHQHVKSP